MGFNRDDDRGADKHYLLVVNPLGVMGRFFLF